MNIEFNSDIFTKEKVQLGNTTEYIVRGGEFDVIEGDWQPNRLVFFRFPNRRAIHDFFDDPEYADLKALRHRTANSIVVAVDGVE